MAHPARHRIAEVIVRSTDGAERRGSGYLVSHNQVLTAAHVVESAASIGVWLGVAASLEPLRGQSVDPARVLLFIDADLALLPVTSESVAADSPPLLGVLERNESAAVHAVAVGCPRFKLRPAPGRSGVQLREVHYALGRIEPGSNVKTGTLEFSVLAGVPSDLEPDLHSPWEGMSGAAVFASSRVIGVVGQHELREADGTLTIRPIAAALERVAEADRWWAALPRPAGAASALDIVKEPTERQLVVGRAQRAARAVAAPVLVAREEEIKWLTAFAVGDERFLWLEGPAFSGKTALLAWVVLHPPEDVDVAACFLRRTTGDADARYLIDVLSRQLSVHADRPHMPTSHPSAERDELLDLLDDAAAAAAQRGRRLLVVVDGLDEDQTAEPGLMIASWLPDQENLPGNVRLLVASRTGVDVPLAPDHALRRCRAGLAPSATAAGLERAAGLELAVARQRGGLLYPVLGTLAAGVGDWTLTELTAALRDQVAHDVLGVEILDTLRSSLSRTVAMDVVDGQAVHIAFAHAALLDEARRLYADDLPTLREVVLKWCHAALLRAESGAALPRYVQRHYVEQLSVQAGWTPLWFDLLRPSWRDHHDASASTYLPLRDDLRRLEGAARAVGLPALVARAAAKAVLAGTSGEIETMSSELAAALVRAGRWSTARALEYLARLENRDERAMAIGVVAPVLGGEAAESALTLYFGLGGHSDDERGCAALGIASLLAAAGDAVRLREFVRSQDNLGASEAGNAAIGALAGVAGQELSYMLQTVAESASALRGLAKGQLARRLGALDGDTRARVEVNLGRSLGRFILDLLEVDLDVTPRVGGALAIALPCLGRDEQLTALERAVWSAIDQWGESELLARVAPYTPLELHELVDSRSAVLAADDWLNLPDRGLVAAGLLRGAEASRRQRLLAELHTGKFVFVSVDDEHEFVRRLAAGGLSVEVLARIKARAADGASGHTTAQSVAVVAPHLPAERLPEALSLCETLEPTWRSRGRAALNVRALEVGRDDLLDLSASRSSDAEQILRLMLEPGPAPGTPEDPWLRSAFTIQLASRGEMSAARCADLLLASLPFMALTEVAAVIRLLPLVEGDAASIIGLVSPERGPLDSGRFVRDVLRAVAERQGIRAIWRSVESGDSQFRLHAATACGYELATDNPERFRRMLDQHPYPTQITAALAAHLGDSERALDQVCEQLSVGELGEGQIDGLRVLEALPPGLRTVVLERVLNDDYLTGRRGYVSDYEWAMTRLSRLAHSLSLRQVDLVEEAIPSGMGSGPRSTLRAALARRRAALQDLDGFERTWRTIASTELRARTLFVALGRYPDPQLPRWLDLSLSFDPRIFSGLRALLWSLGANRFNQLPPALAAEMAGSWLDVATYKQPGEFFTDLLGLVPLLGVATGVDVAQELRAYLVTV